MCHGQSLRGDTAETCRDAWIDGRVRDRPRPKLVRLDPVGAHVSNAVLEVITGLNLDVQVTPPKTPCHLSVLRIVQHLCEVISIAVCHG